MAARTSAGAGVVITISLLGVIAFGLFVVSVILYGDNLDYRKQIEDTEQNYRDYVREADRAEDTAGTVGNPAHATSRRYTAGA